MKVGVLHQDLNVCGGRELLATIMINCLKRRGIKTIIFTGKKIDRPRIRNYYGIEPIFDKEIIVPIWTRHVQTYFEFLLPIFAKNFCDFLINPFSSDMLPLVDITYIHYPKLAILNEKIEKSIFWGLYYWPYLNLSKIFGHISSQKLVLANSLFTSNAIKKVFGLDSKVVYPPVLINKIPKDISQKKNFILTISRFSSDKCLEIIPRIAKSIDAKFVVMGSVYSIRTYYRILDLIRKYGVQDKVVLITNASLETKHKLLQESKVYFHPTHFEHFGISIVEGMAAGCVPIVHDSGGPKEFVPYEWRFTDNEEAKHKINNALDEWSPQLARSMRSIAETFSVERFEKEFLDVLDLFLN